MATSRIVIRDLQSSQLTEDPFKVRGEIKIDSPEWNLNEVWDKCLKPHLEENHNTVLAVCTRLLLQRNLLQRTWGGATDESDWDSDLRSAIAVHEQDEYREALDVIIDATRDSIERLAFLTPNQAKTWIKKFSSSQNSYSRNRFFTYTT